jgi:MoaA/NifB/PqqE/SkfB family radical SAM enzyme
MTSNSLHLFLSKQYNLKCFVDLAQMSMSPSAVYKQFESCYQSVFDNTDRLVFYTSDIIPDTLLQHLYQAAELIDISNYFVLICSPHDIREQLQHVAKQDSFQSLQISVDSTEKLQDNFHLPETMCPMPWMHLEISASGEIRPCCVYTAAVGDVRNASLNSTFNNNTMVALRNEFLLGQRPAGCQHCWRLESKGLSSSRNRHMSLLKKQLLTADLENPTIKSLDIKPGNTCNFKCRICSPIHSSLFAQELNKIRNIAVKTYNWAEENSVVMNEIFDLLPGLTNIDMYGGEPFLIKPLKKLIKQAVEQGYSENMRLHYNSNGSIYPSDLIEHWKKFKHIDIQFSIDNVGSRFELERGGSWQEVESNIKQLLALKLDNVKIGIMPAISIMNIFYIDQLLEWAEALGLPVNPLYVSYPSGFDLKNLTSNAKQIIVNKFKNHSWSEMKNILDYIKSIPDSDGRGFIKLCQHFDSIRNQNFSISHSEIAEAMGYVYNKSYDSN